MASAPNASLARQNFSTASEEALNSQINVEFSASYVYQAMASYCSRDTVSLPGFARFFGHSASEEREHAQKLIDYITIRGGIVRLQPIAAPEVEWVSAVRMVEAALQLEKDVNRSLLNLHKVADGENDAHLADYIESDFLDEQVRSISQLSNWLTQLRRVGSDGLGLYLFDKELQSYKLE